RPPPRSDDCSKPATSSSIGAMASPGARRSRSTRESWASPAGFASVRVVRDPVPGDVDPATDPDVPVLLDAVEKALERGEAPGTPHQAHVEADRHHPRGLR